MIVVAKEGFHYYNADALGLDDDTYNKLYAGGQAEISFESYAQYPNVYDVIIGEREDSEFLKKAGRVKKKIDEE